jgi:hypothetical protein
VTAGPFYFLLGTIGILIFRCSVEKDDSEFTKNMGHSQEVKYNFRNASEYGTVDGTESPVKELTTLNPFISFTE